MSDIVSSAQAAPPKCVIPPWLAEGKKVNITYCSPYSLTATTKIQRIYSIKPYKNYLLVNGEKYTPSKNGSYLNSTAQQKGITSHYLSAFDYANEIAILEKELFDLEKRRSQMRESLAELRQEAIF